MKKLSVLLLTLVFVLTFSACSLFANNVGGGQQNSGSDSAIQSTEGTTQSQATDSAANSNPSSADNTAATQSAQTDTPTQSAQSSSSVSITRDEAINIALNQAGIAKENARDLEAELDRERSIIVWEVDFEWENREYSYDINAQTGAITEREKEFD